MCLDFKSHCLTLIMEAPRNRQQYLLLETFSDAFGALSSLRDIPYFPLCQFFTTLFRSPNFPICHFFRYFFSLHNYNCEQFFCWTNIFFCSQVFSMYFDSQLFNFTWVCVFVNIFRQHFACHSLKCCRNWLKILVLFPYTPCTSY